MKKIKIQLPFSRKKEVNRLRGKLEQESFPRIQMFLLVSITSGAAFLTSYILLHILGLTSLWLRYLLVCIAAYGVFLLLLWLWLRTRIEDYADLGDISDLPDLSLGSSSSEILEGAGGNFGGGGASSSFEETPPVGIGFIGNSENPVVEALGAAGEAEEFALPLIVLILIITVVLSSAFVIYSAPMLFAELLVDSLLAAGLYKKMKTVDRQHWMTTAIKHTILPFVITTVVSVTSGFALQAYEPKANSIGDIIQIIRNTP